MAKKFKRSGSKAKRAVKAVKKLRKAVRAKVKRVVRTAVKQAVRHAVKVATTPPKKLIKQALPIANRMLAPAGLSLVQTQNKHLVGSISHFFDKISVAVVEATGTLKTGDKISIEGPQTNFTQSVGSMQVEHKPVMEIRKGQSAGMKVSKEVRKKDLVYRLA